MYQVVAMVPDPWTASLLIGFLKVSGVTVRDLNTSSHAHFFGGERSYFVEVLNCERGQAAKLLVDEGYGKWVAS